MQNLFLSVQRKKREVTAFNEKKTQSVFVYVHVHAVYVMLMCKTLQLIVSLISLQVFSMDSAHVISRLNSSKEIDMNKYIFFKFHLAMASMSYVIFFVKKPGN